MSNQDDEKNFAINSSFHEEDHESKLIFMDDNEKIENQKSSILRIEGKHNDSIQREIIKDIKFENLENRENIPLEFKNQGNKFEEKHIITEMPKDSNENIILQNSDNILINKEKVYNVLDELNENEKEKNTKERSDKLRSF